VFNEGLYPLAEGNKSEFVIPTDYAKHDRAVQLLHEAKNAVVGSDSSSSAIDALNAKLDTMLTMFAQLLNLNAAQVTAIKAGSFDKSQLYKQQGYDQALADSQSF